MTLTDLQHNLEGTRYTLDASGALFQDRSGVITPTRLTVSVRKARVQVREEDGHLLWSGAAAPDAVRRFVGAYWYDKI